MILQALHDLARRKNLAENPAFDRSVIHLKLSLYTDGRAPRLVSLFTTDPQGKSLAPAPSLVPSVVGRRGDRAGFLVDTCEYVLGVPRIDKKATKKNAIPDVSHELSPGRARRYRGLFRELIGEALADPSLEQSPDRPALRLVHEFLSKLELDDKVRDELLRSCLPWDWEKQGTVGFCLDDGPLVHELPTLRDWWSRRFLSQRINDSSTAGDVPMAQRCLVTGEVLSQANPVARKHTPIKRVPGGNGAGTPLVSFDKSAFQSHRQDQGANAPCGQNAVDGYSAALSYLLSPPPGSSKGMRSGLLLSKDTAVVFWAAQNDNVAEALAQLQNSSEPEALPDWLFEGGRPEADPQQAVTMVRSPWRGLLTMPDDIEQFYALTLSGVNGRVSIRDWYTESARDLARNLLRYFDDLALQRPDGQTQRMAVPLSALVQALQTRPTSTKDKGELVTALKARLFRCALTGEAFPLMLLTQALQRVRLPRDDKQNTTAYESFLAMRCGLIKAVLRRANPSRNQELGMSLDESNTATPYLLGRLFAVMEKMQQRAADGELSTTIRDSYFAAASTKPASVFGRLFNLSQHHASKLKKQDKGWLEGRKTQIVSLLAAAPLPATLRLEDQGLFAIGYYHERAYRPSPRGGAGGTDPSSNTPTADSSTSTDPANSSKP